MLVVIITLDCGRLLTPFPCPCPLQMAHVQSTLDAVQMVTAMELVAISPATVTMPAISLATAVLTSRPLAALVTAPVSTVHHGGIQGSEG